MAATSSDSHRRPAPTPFGPELRANVAALTPYTPGEQPDDPRVVKLNTNENPYPPPPEVMQAVAAVTPEQLRRYPSPSAAGFREVAARVHQLSPEQIIACNGGDELLRLVITAYCEPASDGQLRRGGLAVTDPTYSLYAVLAEIHGSPVTAVPLDDRFQWPADLAQRWNDAGARVGIVVSPHAPSGLPRSLDALAGLADAFQGLLVIDEAYVDFAPGSALALVRPGEALDNVLILRSMSKGYSLAGLRFGYGLGAPGVIDTLARMRDSYNVDALAQAAAAEALRRRDLAAHSWAKVRDAREQLAASLRRRGAAVLPSAANFLLATPPVDAGWLYRQLKARGVLVRYFDTPRLRDRLRITIGAPKQNRTLLDTWDQLVSEAAPAPVVAGSPAQSPPGPGAPDG